MLKKVIVVSLSLILLALVSVIFLDVLDIALNTLCGASPFCEPCDPYYTDSPCFDPDLRCEIECGHYGLNYTGHLEGCACDCGPGEVSFCSGFYYPKEVQG